MRFAILCTEFRYAFVVHILPIRTPLIRLGGDLAAVITGACVLATGDIVVVSSKAVATAQGAAIDLRSLHPTDEAVRIAARFPHRSPAFVQAILNETSRMHGRVLDDCPGAMLTELRPQGLPRGVLIVPNAGLDQSNIEEGKAIGWPRDPVLSIRHLRRELEHRAGLRPAVLMTDSCCRPGRLGVTALAMTLSGIDPFRSLVGTPDLYGHPLRFTQEAIADQLATMANAVMGNAADSIPAAIIRDHGIPMSDFEGWVPGIEPEEDLFRGMYKP